FPTRRSSDLLREKFEETQLPEAVRKAVERELGRLERTSEQTPEHGWMRRWLDTMADLPWGTRTQDDLDVTEARRILDADHTGLEDVKARIVESLAVRKLRAERGIKATDGREGGAIVALVGPPGVGKTSLGQSVAPALGLRAGGGGPGG